MSESQKNRLDTYYGIVGQINTLKRGTDSSPHKYILLLSIISIFDKEPNHINLFYFSEVEPVFIDCFNQYFPNYADYRKMLEHPFYYLKNDGFWSLQIKGGQKAKFEAYEKKRLTKNRILETIEYAYLSEDIYQLFLDNDRRQQLKNEIISVLPGQYELNEQSDLLIKESSLFEHEKIAIETIRNTISRLGLGRTLNNVLIYDNQSKNYYEYDLVVISHAGLYVVELKHWSGRIQIAPYNWLINGIHYRNDPHKNNGFKCKILKGIYQHRFRTYPNIWVESIVVLTNPDVEVEGADSSSTAAKDAKHNFTFSSIGEFVTYIKKRDVTDKPILNNEQIQNIADCLQGLNQPKRGIKYAIQGHETVEYLSQRPESIELLARPIGPIARGLNRFRVFRVPDTLTGQERERYKRRAYNTISTVSKLKEHPNILKVWLVPSDDGDIIEGSDWSETGTLRDYIDTNRGILDIDEIHAICYGIAQGLIAAHQNNIIHRAVSPENILLFNGLPKLMNFDLAYQMDEDHLTVITDIESLTDDGYIAPEVLLGQDIDESTDFFALGVIAYELITGSRPFQKVRQFLKSADGRLNESNLQQLRNKEIPSETIDIIEALIRAERNSRLISVDKVLEVFSGDRISGEKPIAMMQNARLKAGETYDMYEIIEFIGEGREAQIYKARNGRSEIIALKLFNREIERERIFREGDFTAAVKSAYVVGCNNTIGHWKDDRYFLVLEYLEGESMRELINRHEIPTIEGFRNISMCLLQGIQAFHKQVEENGEAKTILHSDIKPDNIIITKDGKAVLIDFGLAGPPRVDVFQGTLAYIPPDNLSGVDMQFSEDGDLFALGITLWEWLCGQRPYEKPALGEKSYLNPECLERVPKNLRECLLKSIAAEREQRYIRVEDMIADFTGMNEEEKPVTEAALITYEVVPGEDIEVVSADLNPFVYYLNSLSNASAGNENATAEAQIGNGFFEKIRVEHPASQFIYRKLFEEKKNVILTGNAGDGKTTIAAEVYRRRFGQYKPLMAKEEHADLVIIKDLSEIPEQERKEIFREAIQHPEKSYLIVSNTGTLLENLGKAQLEGSNIDKSQLLTALEADQPEPVGDGSFLIVNIGRINTITAAMSVFERMLDADNWESCRACSRAQDCPILYNVELLQENRALIVERISLAYRRLYEYGNRLTMRQMTGHLAYTITAGLNREDVIGMSKISLEQQFPRYLFFNRFFGDDGRLEIPEAMQLMPVRKIRQAELGIYLDPLIERTIWKRQPEGLHLSPGAIEVLCHIRGDREDSRSEARIQMRRLLYFLLSSQENGALQYLKGFLQSPMLLTYLRHVEENQPFTRSQEERHLRILLQVLQECFAGVRLPEGEYRPRDLYITLRPPGYSTTQMILGKAHVEDFSLALKNVYSTGEITNRVLTMRYKNDRAELELDLPFLDYVARRYQGAIAEELSVFYTDRLQKFKVVLLENLKNAPQEGQIELLSMAQSRSFKNVSIKVDGERLEVIM